MATDTARSTATRPRRLWQVPAFLLGAATLVAVALARPYWHDDRRAAEHQLAAARDALEQSPPALAQAVQHGQRVLDALAAAPYLAGEAHFIVGSAQLRLADEPGANAAGERQQARQHLEAADRAGVPESDRPKLRYRLAKAALLTGADPAPAAAALEKSIDAADDPAEGYGLLAQAYARLTPPDLTKALEATKKQLDRVLTSDARLQAQARFRLGELHLQLKNVKEGRLWLGRVGTEAPPEQFFAARVLLAESYEETQEWAQAARNWVAAREDPRLPPAAKARILYRLGRCYAQDQRPKEAESAWAEALALGGDEAQAAALRLAEVRLDAEPRTALEPLAVALRAVQVPEDYHNPLVSLDEARQLLEKSAQAARAKDDWETAEKVAELYARVALPGNADAVAGLTADARAQALIEQAKKAPAEQAPALEEQAREQQRQAGLAYERAAGKVAAGPEQENWLWNSAQRFLQAKQTAKAQELLLRYTQLEGVAAAERIAEAWYRLASTYGELKQYAAARKAYEHCLKPGNPYFLRARHGLAKIDIAEGQFDAAEQALQENLKALREASQPDAELQERTLYELATVAYTRQDSVKEPLREYGTASERLLGALQQYPDSPVAARARITLAICYWNEALIKDKALEASRTGGTTSLTDEERKTYRRQRNEFLQKALEQCETLEEQLRSRQNNGGRLSPEEAAYYKQAMFWGADCYCYLGRFDQALSRYGALALRYQRKPEELIALSQIRQCYVHMNMPDKVAGVVERLREALNNIPDAAFDGSLPTHRRQYWVDWLQRATQPAIPPAESAPEK